MGIQGGGGFVEDEHRRVLQQYPGDGYALFLAAGELQPALAYLGIQPLRQTPDEVFQLGHAQRLPDLLFAGAGSTIGDVEADGIVEQHGILRHNTDVLAQAFLADAADVLPVDTDAAAIHVIEAEQQTRQGRLASAAGTYHRQRMPRRDGEADPMQDRSISLIGKGHIVEADAASADLEFRRCRQVAHLYWRVQQAEQPLDVDKRLADLAVDEAEEVEWDKQLDHVGIDHHQLAQGHGATGDLIGGHDHQQRHRAGNDQGLTRIQRGQ